MKLRTKKILAREFLMLLSVLLIGLITFLGTYVYNYFVHAQTVKLEKTITKNFSLADSLSKAYNTKPKVDENLPLTAYKNDPIGILGLPIFVETGYAKLKVLYSAVSKKYDIGSFEAFKQKLQDPGKRQLFYDAVSKDYDLGSLTDFNKKISANLQIGNLNEEDRRRLDGIVLQMTHKGASQEEIQSVVDDFKWKYTEPQLIKLSLKDFAQKVKAKYPEYKNVADTVLAKAIVEKYPIYTPILDISYSVPNQTDSLNYRESLILHDDINKLENQFTHYSNRILSNDDQLQLTLFAILISFILLFCIRYLFYSIKWSVKTLRQKAE